MEKIVCGIIYNNQGEVLVVDKPKPNNRVLTILPGGKSEGGESLKQTLIREIQEELGVQANIIQKIGYILGETPTSKTKSQISFYEVTIDSGKLRTTAEVENPRFMSLDEIKLLDTTTQITKDIIITL